MKRESRKTPSATQSKVHVFDQAIAWFERFSKQWGIYADLTRFSLIVLIALLALDVAAVIYDVTVTLLHKWNKSSTTRWLMDQKLNYEYGFWAIIGYAKLFCAFVLLAGLFARTRLPSYGLLAIVFLYLAIDDTLLFHERSGDFLASRIDLSGFGMITAHHIGELIFFATVGTILIGLLIIAILLAPREHRMNAWIISFFVLGIGFFAAAVDFIDKIVDQFSSRIGYLTGLLENNGENVVVSLTIAFLIMIWTRVISSELPKLKRERR